MSADENEAHLTWAHIGDLHITDERAANYRDFCSTIESLNANLAGQVDFCVLPGDNADDGTPAEYALIRRGLDALQLPLHVIPGDHDRKSGDLGAFYRGLNVPLLPYAVSCGGHRCLFLDVVSEGNGGPDFAMGRSQLDWLQSELEEATRRHEPCVVFMHAYPADLKAGGESLRQLFRTHRVVFVDMGHTHYNELANDGMTIFAATRSTGQVEEGPVGFSLASLNDGVVSWRFKPLTSAWPLVVITSPSDHRLAIDPAHPAHVVAGLFKVCARVFGSSPAVSCRCRIDDESWLPLRGVSSRWETVVEARLRNRPLTLTVEATNAFGNTDRDVIVVATSGHQFPVRTANGSDSDSIKEWPERHLLGTRLGPNRNGRQW